MTKKTITIKEAAEKYLAHLREVGKNERTVYTYGEDLKLALDYFGEDKDVAKIMPVHVAAFFKADSVNKIIREPKKEGEPRRERDKSPITVTKTKRVFRQMLVFCKDQKWIDKIPLTKDELARVKDKTGAEQPAAGDQAAGQEE